MNSNTPVGVLHRCVSEPVAETEEPDTAGRWNDDGWAWFVPVPLMLINFGVAVWVLRPELNEATQR